MYNYFIGIDPGLTGYVVVLDKHGKYIERIKTPTVKIKKKNHIDADALLLTMQKYKDNAICCVERQHPMPKQGLASTGKTMYGFGLLVGLLKGTGIQTEVIGAKEWQKVYLDPNIEDSKEASVAAAKKWKKGIDLHRTKKCKTDDHNLADAINICRYTYYKFCGS